MKTAILNSGQGSQYIGMLKDIAEKYPQAKEQIHHADSILNYSLSEICFEGPAEKLKETRYTQPALFLHSAVVFDIVKNKLEFDCIAGHSVGEYASLYSAGVLSFEDALKLVALRGELMFKAGESKPGTMFAIINLDDEIVKKVCQSLTENSNGDVVVPANFNSPGQIVVSGSAEYLRNNINAFKEAGAKIVKELIVSGAFHSPLIEPTKLELEKAIKNTTFKDSVVPIYCNVYASPVQKANELKVALIAQLTSPVLWTQTLISMKNNGVSRFVEIGAGNVLQGLVKRTLSDVEFFGLDKSDEIDKFLSK